jgi:hypothetical protein
MSDDPFADIEDFDDDVGLDEEDRQHATAPNQLEWFKGDKGRTYRISLLYFHPIEASIIRRARKKAKTEGVELTKDQAIALVKQALTKRAEELGKAVDQLTPVDKLDLNHVRFKKVLAHYKEGVGYALSRLGKDGPEADKIWQMMGDQKKYFCTVALIYPTKPQGQVIKEQLGTGWSVMPWRCHSGIYRDLIDETASLAVNKIKIAEQDLKCKCTNGDYQNFDINAAGPSIWRMDEKFKARVLAAAVELYDKLIPFRELSTADLRIKLGLTSDNQGEDVSDIDFDGLMPDDDADAGPMADV